MRITVIVTEEEHAKIKRAAGLIPLSAFVRDAILARIGAKYDPDIVTRNFDKFSKLLVTQKEYAAAKKGKRTA